MNSPTKKPIRKIRAVWAAGVSSTVAITAVLLWALPTFFDVSIDEAAAGGLAALVVTVVTGLSGYMAKNDPGDFNYRAEGKAQPVVKREKIK